MKAPNPQEATAKARYIPMRGRREGRSTLHSEVKLHPSMKALPPPQGGAAGNVGVQEISLDNIDSSSSMKVPTPPHLLGGQGGKGTGVSPKLN